MMKASRSEDDNNDTKETFDAMIAEHELLVDGLANRGRTPGVPATGAHAAGKKRQPNTGAHAAGKKRQPNTGKHAAGKPRQPRTGKAKKGVPKTGKAKKGPTHWGYIDIAWRPECATDGCTALKRANGRDLAGTRTWRKTCCSACK